MKIFKLFVFVIIASIMVHNYHSVDFRLRRSTGDVTVSYIEKITQSGGTMCFASATGEEIFADDTVIIKGEVLETQDIKISVGEYTENGRIASIKIDTVYRGDLNEGDVIEIFYAIPDIPDMSAVKAGAIGIFMPIKTNDSQYIIEEESLFYLTDITDYLLIISGYYHSIENDDGIWFVEKTYESFDEIEEYIYTMIE